MHSWCILLFYIPIVFLYTTIFLKGISFISTLSRNRHSHFFPFLFTSYYFIHLLSVSINNLFSHSNTHFQQTLQNTLLLHKHIPYLIYFLFLSKSQNRKFSLFINLPFYHRENRTIFQFFNFLIFFKFTFSTLQLTHSDIHFHLSSFAIHMHTRFHQSYIISHYYHPT